MTTEPHASLVEARARFALAAAQIERDVRLSDLTDTEIDSLAEALRTQGDGRWVLVPREPTRAICEAIETAMTNGRTDHAWLEAVAASPTQASSREEG